MTDVADRAWIGIDLGTQSVRVLAAGDDGRSLGAASVPLSGIREGSRHEQDPEAWWQAVCTATRRVVDGLTVPVAGIAVDGTSGTLLLADAAGVPLTPGIMYDDARGAALLEPVNAAGRGVWEQLGYGRMQATWALPKLAWLQSNHPALVTATGTQIMHQTDFINYRLAGHRVTTDLSSALKTGVDLLTEDWPFEVFDALGLPATLLPAVVRSGTQLAVVGAEAAALTGLPEGTPITAGATDGCAAQLGAGALEPGDWNSVLGTTLVLKGVTETLIRDPLGVVYSHKGPDGTWLPGGASSSGAGIIAQNFPGADLLDLENAAQAFHPGPATTYPLHAGGERFPFTAPDARSFTIGDPHGTAERYAAVLQGLAFVERLCFDYLAALGAPATGRVLLTGGGAQSRYWSQLRADVLGRPVYLPENPEPALGSALLAACGVTGRKAADIAGDMIRIRSVVEPRPDYAGYFIPGYLAFLDALETRGWLTSDVASRVRKDI